MGQFAKAPVLTLNTKQLAELNELAGHPISSAEDLLSWARQLNTIQLNDGIEVELEGDDLDTLRHQAIGMGAVSVEDYIREFIHEAIGFQLHGSYRGR